MNTESGETWREAVDRELGHLSEKLDLRLAAQARALKLQAQEYERRLEKINGEIARLGKEYDEDLEAARKSKEEVMKYINEQNGMALGKAKAIALATGTFAVLISLASSVAAWVWRSP